MEKEYMDMEYEYNPIELKDTVDHMISDDWKKRFIAEYAQLITRIDSIVDLMWEDEEKIKEIGPLDLIDMQVEHMNNYKRILDIRAEIYGIDMDKELEKLQKKEKIKKF